MEKSKTKNQDTLDDSAPVFGTWNNWYVGVVIFNILFISFITYLFNHI